MGVAGAELHVVADHDHGDAARRQRAKDGGELLLEFGVQPLGGLVQQQYLRVKEQNFTQRGALLLPAGQVVGVAIQQLRQAAEGHGLRHPLFPKVRGQRLAVERLVQVLTDGFFHEKRLGILRQHTDAAGVPHRTAVGRQGAAEQVERRGLAGAVAAQQGQQLPLIHGEVKTPHHIRLLRRVAEPQSLRRQHRAAAGMLLRRGQRAQGVRRLPAAQEIPSLPDGDGGGLIAADGGPDPHGGGHGQKHAVAPAAKLAAYLRGGAGTQQASAVQHGGVGGKGQRILQPVLRQENGGAQLAVDAAQRLQKVGGGDGIQLAGGLVQYQHLGLHHHDGGKAQQLLLAAGQLIHGLVEPALDAEKRRHLRHAAADGGGIAAHALQSEGQLVPDLVRHHLMLRRLEDEADVRRLLAQGDIPQGHALKPNLPLGDAMGCENGLELTQQRGFAAAGGAAQHPEFAGANGEVDADEGGAALLGVGEAEAGKTEQLVHIRHLLSCSGGSGAGTPTTWRRASGTAADTPRKS